MQGRHKNPNDGGRGYNSNYRNYNRSGSVNFSHKPYLPPPPRAKEEILMEAGRLAAEYLVFKGLLPASSLPPKWQNGKYPVFKGKDRDPPVTDGRTTALNRLGNLNSDAASSRRRYSDEYNDRLGLRNQFRGKKRMSPYSRENSSDWARESSRRWMGRNRGYNDTEDEDEFAPGYHRDRRSGFDQLPSRSEYTGESGSEKHDIAEDTGSKVNSSSTRRDPPIEVDWDLSKAMVDDGKAINSEAGDEVKSDASADSKKKNQEEESDAQPCGTEGDSKSGDDLMKLCSFAIVPTRPRSSAARRSPKTDQGVITEASNTGEGSSEEPKMTSGEDISGGSLNNSPTNQTGTSQAPEILSVSSVQPGVEHIDQQQEGSQSPPGFGSLKATVGETDDANKREGMKRRRDSSLENEFSQMYNVRSKQSSPEVEKSPVDEENVAPVMVLAELPMDETMAAPFAIDQEQPLGDALILKVEPELDDKLEEEKQLLSSSFKTCDLNLMQAPEITGIPDGPDSVHLHSSAPRLETEKDIFMDFGLSIGNNSNGPDDFSTVSGDDKVVQVIDLEDDSIVDCGASDPSRPKDEPIYPNLDSFLNQPEHADLPGIQDGYSLAISEFLGSDISCCPSVSSDLNNLETGMSLHDEGIPNDDDSIYVSLGEIPIRMDLWRFGTSHLRSMGSSFDPLVSKWC